MTTSSTPDPLDRSSWKCVKFCEVFEAHRNNTCARAMMQPNEGRIRNIHYGDILVKYGEVVSLMRDKIDFLTPEGEKFAAKDYLQDGDIVIADTAEDEMVGKVVEVQEVKDEKVVAGLHTLFYRPKKDTFARGWLGYWLNSKCYHDQLLPFMTGIKVLSVSRQSLSETLIQIPPLPVQRRIASSLSAVDGHLASLGELVSKYEAIKKSTVSLLLRPQPTWQKVRLGDVGEIAMCKRILKSQTSESGDVPFFKIGTFGKTPDAFISRELFEDFKRRFSFPKKGDVLLSAAGTIGRTVVFDGEDAYFQDSNIVWIKNDEKIVTNKFLHLLYGQVEWQTENGGTVSRLYNANIEDTVVRVPPLSEQRRIVTALSSLDGVLSSLAAEREKLVSLKRGLLRHCAKSGQT